MLLFNSWFYFSLLTWEIKRFILVVVFFTTCILPILTMATMALNPKFNFRMDKPSDRVLPLLFTAVYYYIGYYLLNNLNIIPVAKMFLISSSLVIIALLLISFRWKISLHMAAIGGMASLILAGTFIIAGIVGVIRIYFEKHTLAQVTAGFLVGFWGIFIPVFFL
jgi:membrane-associated phospholipid phosphatase